jgi:hypothetical protein
MYSYRYFNEIVYAIFLLSGQIKLITLFFNINIPDITLLSGLFLVINILYNLFIKRDTVSKYFINILIINITIIFFILISLMYTSSNDYSYIKSYMYILIIISALYPFGNKEFSAFIFIKYFILLSVLISISYMYLYPKLLIKELIVQDQSIFGLYLMVAYISGLCILLLFIFKKELFKNKYLTYILISFFIFILLISGARGPLIFTILSLLLLFIIDFNIKKILITTILSSIFISTVLINNSNIINKNLSGIAKLQERSINRISLIFEENKGNSIGERTNMITFVQDKYGGNLTNIIFGYGIGSFGIEYLKVDIRYHPHNIVLEFLFELGLIGLTLFLIYIYYFLNIIKRSKQLIMLAPFIYLLLNALKTSSFVEQRLFFGFMSILILITTLTNLKRNQND